MAHHQRLVQHNPLYKVYNSTVLLKLEVQIFNLYDQNQISPHSNT